MKHLVLALLVSVFMLSSSVNVFAQATETVQNVTIDLSKVDPALKAQIEAAQTLQKTEANIKQYGKWVGLGHEVAVLIDEIMGAISKHANAFADTKVGIFVMVLIAFKVLGYPIIQLAVGIPLIIVGTIFFVKILKSICLPRKIKTITITGEGKEKVKTIKEELVEPDQNWYSAFATLIYVCYLALCMAVIFAH